ncbi:hypothetical protein [Streptomyces tropicalis]|uniref:Lipoprotein n=1 Tax=Streptomyces tropicalis TaxID=3034234 RepID=A0ABT6A3H3_9ACTN|nr:hypothetical protein [Streptomyces tropicalis]MDF3299187.1 hypothetical protein [Streptomyces tropicalis]
MSPSLSPRVRGRRPRLTPAVLLCAAAAAVLAGCGSGGGSGPAASSPASPNTASFSGSPPSAMASSAASAVGSAQASASAAASSAAARASEFEASVSADTARAAATAQKELKNVAGRGNALPEVSMQGLPRARTGGVLAVLVTITNRTDHKASYAVQVDFKNADGHVVETRYVGAENLAPGRKAQPIAFSRSPAEPRLTPALAKAQRY